MGLIKGTLVVEIFKALDKTVRPHVDYANQVWNPHLMKDVEMVENVQRRTTSKVPELKGLI